MNDLDASDVKKKFTQLDSKLRNICERLENVIQSSPFYDEVISNLRNAEVSGKYDKYYLAKLCGEREAFGKAAIMLQEVCKLLLKE